MSEKVHERLKNPIPVDVIRRRWKIVQDAMKRAEIDVILSQSVTNYFGSNIRYLTDLTAEHGYTLGVLLDQEGEPNIVAYGGPPQECSPPKFAIRVGTLSKNRPYFPPFNWTHDWEPKMAMEWLGDRKIRRMGIEMGLTNMNYLNYLEKHLPGVEFVDIADLMDPIRAVKTVEELEYQRKSAWVLDKAFRAIPDKLYAGVKEYELRNFLIHILTDHDGEEFVVRIGSAPADGVVTPYPSFLQNRTLEDGDQVYVSVTASGFAGHYTTVGRMFSIGTPSVEMEQSVKLAAEAEAYLMGLIKPGAQPAELLKAYNTFLEQRGSAPQTGLFAYGEGYDYMERPCLHPAETMKIQENMCLALNIAVSTPCGRAYCADSVIVTASGCEKLSGIPGGLLSV